MCWHYGIHPHPPQIACWAQAVHQYNHKGHKVYCGDFRAAGSKAHVFHVILVFVERLGSSLTRVTSCITCKHDVTAAQRQSHCELVHHIRNFNVSITYVQYCTVHKLSGAMKFSSKLQSTWSVCENISQETWSNINIYKWLFKFVLNLKQNLKKCSLDTQPPFNCDNIDKML